MAWIDNRAWCHDKIAGISDAAFRVWVSSICYSSGFLLEGKLHQGHLRVIGSTAKIRRELEDAGLWIDDGPRIEINDWENHNGARDRKERERRIRDAERKRAARESAKSPADSPSDSPVDTGADIHADGAPVTVEEVKSEGLEQNQKPFSNENVEELLTTTRLRSVS